MIKLSLTIPTFNEEKNIRIPLDSAIKWVDEVVIMDGGSDDKTVEIAESYGKKVKVYHVDNPPNFLINKQRAIERAKGEWILQLDADEAISEELRDEMLNLIENSGETNGYFLPRKNFFLGRYLMKGGIYPDYVLRLYRKKNAHFPLKDLHENVHIEGDIGYTKEALLHYADPNFDRYIMRWNRYTTFDGDLLAKEKKSLSIGDGLNYFIVKPTVWFLKTYFRHKGFMDGFPGFVFSLFSSVRFWVIFIKAWNTTQKK